MSEESQVLSNARLVGRVKWFNNKSGFGFITVCEGEHKDKDIFVHYSSIRAESQQYKYLVQGEYVEFVLIKSDSTTHEFYSSDVSGIKEGILMCETHRQNNSHPVRGTSRYQGRGGARDEGGDYHSRHGAGFPRASGESGASADSQPGVSGPTDGEGFSEVKRRKRGSYAQAAVHA